ncbi:MAG: SAM-dependent methyltransferase [Akkermansiaceae bacterium]|nr:SAM-dependent methyltransferase [Akkermansiaceae bacterium]
METKSPLSEKIRSRISANGPIRFRDYMAMALYDPEFGYYASPTQRVGRQGDFITSVSVGRCFGLILARRLMAFWEESGKPEAFHIIEPGAHDGALGADILEEIKRCSPDCYNAVHYHLVEVSRSLREAQQATLGPRFDGKFSCRTTLSEMGGLHGAVISNELIDAFPVDLIRFENGGWVQLLVHHEGDAGRPLRFISAELQDRGLQSFCASLGNQFPDGYTTEYSAGIGKFVSEAAAALESGLFITIDYGHGSDDYYHPDRSEGTLQTYHQHRKSDNPLEFPGEIDITCHVDFTRLEKAAVSAGFKNPRLQTQASYLTNHARDWLIGLESAPGADDAALLRQFQTLTHPAMLGTRFLVLEMTRG